MKISRLVFAEMILFASKLTDIFDCSVMEIFVMVVNIATCLLDSAKQRRGAYPTKRYFKFVFF